MPELDWKEHEFIQVLGVLPTNTGDVKYVFDVVKDGARLIVTVWPCESVIGISLGTASLPNPLVTFAVFVRSAALLQEREGEWWLELRDCMVAPSRFSYLELGDPFDRGAFPRGQPVRIWVRSQIFVEWRRKNETS
jgi:hypothetical protein